MKGHFQLTAPRVRRYQQAAEFVCGSEQLAHRTDNHGFVLVVDDERAIADTLASILRNAKYEVAVAYDAASALRQCDSKPPDLVISDVVMPGMTGIELAIQIRQQNPFCKILLFSGMAESADLLEEARQDGYEFDLLAKPIHPADLLAKLQD